MITTKQRKTHEMNTYKKVSTKAQVENDPRVDKIWREVDSEGTSYWCYLKPEFRVKGMGSTIHERTIKDVARVLNTEVVNA